MPPPASLVALTDKKKNVYACKKLHVCNRDRQTERKQAGKKNMCAHRQQKKIKKKLSHTTHAHLQFTVHLSINDAFILELGQQTRPLSHQL